MDVFYNGFQYVSESLHPWAAVFAVFFMHYVSARLLSKQLKKQKEHRVRIQEKFPFVPPVSMRHPALAKISSIFEQADGILGSKEGAGLKIHQVGQWVQTYVPNNRYVKAALLRDELADEELASIQQKMEDVIKEEKGRSMGTILLVACQMIVFALPLLFLYTVEPIGIPGSLPFITVILTGFVVLTRKNAILFAPLYFLVFIIYQKLTGALMLYLFYLALFRSTHKYMIKWKKAKERKRKDIK